MLDKSNDVYYQRGNCLKLNESFENVETKSELEFCEMPRNSEKIHNNLISTTIKHQELNNQNESKFLIQKNVQSQLNIDNTMSEVIKLNKFKNLEKKDLITESIQQNFQTKKLTICQEKPLNLIENTNLQSPTKFQLSHSYNTNNESFVHEKEYPRKKFLNRRNGL